MRRSRVGARAALTLLFLAACVRAAPGAPRKVAFIGCLAKPENAELGRQLTESVEKSLARERLSGFEFLPHAAAPARERLKGGPVTAPRLAEAGRAVGADDVIVCLITYERERAAEVPETYKTVMATRQETEFVEEEYYEEVPNPDYEEPTAVTLPVGHAGHFNFAVTLKSKQQPKTIMEKHVRRVPKKRTYSEEVREPDAPASEKPGHVRLRAAYIVLDAVSGKVEKRDAVSYYNEIQPIFDAMESDDDLRRKAMESTVESLDRSIVAKLASKPGK